MGPKGVDLGLLLLRVAVGVTMLLSHGVDKLLRFSELAPKFPDPIGLGSTLSLGLTVFAEAFCSALLIVGLATRLSAIPLLITMLVAFFVIHGADPFQKRELALLYGCIYATLLAAGGGRFSLDRVIKGRRRSSALEISV